MSKPTRHKEKVSDMTVSPNAKWYILKTGDVFLDGERYRVDRKTYEIEVLSSDGMPVIQHVKENVLNKLYVGYKKHSTKELKKELATRLAGDDGFTRKEILSKDIGIQLLKPCETCYTEESIKDVGSSEKYRAPINEAFNQGKVGYEFLKERLGFSMIPMFCKKRWVF